MRALIIGSGGREHALAWKIMRGGRVEKLFCAPGNGGTALEGENVPLRADDVEGLVAFAKANRVDLAIPGPEVPLALGVTDAMRAAGISCFGPDAWCARLEGSKAFAKKIMETAGVPTADCGVFDALDPALAYVRRKGAPIVVKADGLAAGKGVTVAKTLEEAEAALQAIFGGVFGPAGNRVVVEEFLEGEEVSLMAFCSGETAVPMPSAQDHKAAFDGDLGPNTGGMGAYSPAPVLPDAALERLTDLVIRPVLRELSAQGHTYVGVLYAGLMMTASGPKVLEYNVRFGDPECQPLLMRLENDLIDVAEACLEGRLDKVKLSVRPESALGVVLAAVGYPGSYPKGMEIQGIEDADALKGVKIFQAGTKLEAGKIVADGGRILCATALGADLAEAKRRAYAAAAKISAEKTRRRSDVGDKGLKRLASRPKVAVFMGSASDEASVGPCAGILKGLGIPFLMTVASAHRTPERVAELVEKLEADGCEVFVCAAGMAAHLAGAVAARTLKPTIGVPLSSSPLKGTDALLSTVQMPPGYPVATVSLDGAGAKNAAWLAAEILALKDPALAERLRAARAELAADVEKSAAEIEAKCR